MVSAPQTDINWAFGSALLDPDIPLPVGVTGPRGKKAEKRFAVYRNNVVVSLVNALGDIFPAIRTLVGRNNFGHIAGKFVRAFPPGSPLLFEYGRDFPDFIAGLDPLRKYAYLPDVARLERAWLDAFHAADAVPLGFDALAAIEPAQLGELVFTAHPATRIVESDHAIVAITMRSRAGASLAGIKPDTPETALVTRPDAAVELRALDRAGGTFFRSLLHGEPLGAAAGRATEADGHFDLAAAIAALIESGAFTALSTAQTTTGGE
ncbi:DNA-binding domain-containing protein [Pseudohoeflea suaedae]|nr:DNA-binding domain-containing protein [Pseudohoeflea suaedae]